eukprot:FR742349.1.p1 GENE.FR742349.1~~FR742349.1.p1  ORF type:complete len:109 (+),score=3.35 FR742349.1:521-847(+)
MTPPCSAEVLNQKKQNKCQGMPSPVQLTIFMLRPFEALSTTGNSSHHVGLSTCRFAPQSVYKGAFRGSKTNTTGLCTGTMTGTSARCACGVSWVLRVGSERGRAYSLK